MIFLGKIPITWDKEDYINCEYKSHPNPYRGFTATGNENTNSVMKVDLHICYGVNEKIKQCLEHFNLNNVAIQLQKYLPNDYLPFHQDTYATYKKFYNILEKESIVRFIVFLHDSVPGQQLWIEDKMYAGKAGDYFGWSNSTIHMAANLSNEPRYNLQITGTTVL